MTDGTSGSKRIKLLRRFDEYLNRRYYAPVFLLGILMASIFTAEVFVMYILAKMPPMTNKIEAVFDGLLLTMIVAPILYLFAFRPLVVHIIERRKIERFKDDMVKILCHDLKNPLWVVRENMKLILTKVCGDLTREQEDILDDIRKAVDYLIRLSQNMLDVSQLEEGKMKLRKDHYDIALLVRDVSRYFKKRAEIKGVDIIVDIKDSAMQVSGDMDKIEEVLLNLIGNAVKFTDKGYISISARRIGNIIECVIKDTGRGIASGDLKALFEIFRRFGPQPDGEMKGTGLGLAICKQIIELHGGSIDVTSEIGKGTTVSFTLPAAHGVPAANKDYEI